MARRAVLQALFAFLLLAGQQSAFIHSVWHLHDQFPAQERQESGAHSHEDDHSSQSRLCDLHGALGALLAGDCAGKPALVTAKTTILVATHAIAWRIAQPVTTPPSRAPPAFS